MTTVLKQRTPTQPSGRGRLHRVRRDGHSAPQCATHRGTRPVCLPPAELPPQRAVPPRGNDAPPRHRGPSSPTVCTTQTELWHTTAASSGMARVRESRRKIPARLLLRTCGNICLRHPHLLGGVEGTSELTFAGTACVTPVYPSLKPGR